ncbi:MAG TPA: hypothetical protein QGF58_27740, partial [Myxococcota bacterium]|nr:hypothetical protein [Myxococcota bacterium]
PPVHAYLFVDNSLSADSTREEVPRIVDEVVAELEAGDALSVYAFAGDVTPVYEVEDVVLDLELGGLGARVSGLLGQPSGLYTFYSPVFVEVDAGGAAESLVVIVTDGEGSDPVNRSRSRRDEAGLTDIDWRSPAPRFVDGVPVLWILDGHPEAEVHPSAGVAELDERFTLVTWNTPGADVLGTAVQAALPADLVETSGPVDVDVGAAIAELPWGWFGAGTLGVGLIFFGWRKRYRVAQALDERADRLEEDHRRRVIEASATRDIELQVTPLWRDDDSKCITLREEDWTPVGPRADAFGADWSDFPTGGLLLRLVDGDVQLKPLNPFDTLVIRGQVDRLVSSGSVGWVEDGDIVATADGTELVRLDDA